MYLNVVGSKPKQHGITRMVNFSVYCVSLPTDSDDEQVN